MQAVILAAGMGKRLGKLTDNNTKCMLKVYDRTLIERMLDILSKTKIREVVIVIGYKGENVKKLVGDKYKGLNIHYVKNPIYDKTNNIYSLYLAKDYLIKDDTLLLESDLIFNEELIFDLISNPYPSLAVVSPHQSWMDGTVVTLDDDNNIVNFLSKSQFKYSDTKDYYKTVNIYKFSKEFCSSNYVPFLEAYCKALGHNEYYEQVLRIISLLEKQSIKGMQVSHDKWYEIDDIQDLHNAETLFAPDDKILETYQKRYGGYWRFPNLIDFCYLVNPYFPPQKMENEMKCYFHQLLSHYPSGLHTQNLLASKMFNCDVSEITVGNGATELINALSKIDLGKTGIVYPTFNEYPERFGEDKIKKLVLSDKNFSYTADDLIRFSSEIDTLLLINPDNPSGNMISRQDVLKLAGHLLSKNKRLLLDESFVDFSEQGAANSLIDSDILQKYPNLIIIKSISKSYGVPGIRLGVIATSDKDITKQVRRNISIWNINSFGEFFLQIIGKYQKEYNAACLLVSKERERFFKELSGIKILRVIPSQSNYFLCEVLKKYTSAELTLALLKQSIFIKDCAGKTGFENKNYVRIAIRDEADNNRLLEALSKL